MKRILITMIVLCVAALISVSCIFIGGTDIDDPTFVAPKLDYIVNVDGETCTIKGFGEYTSKTLDIPEEIDGYKVVAILTKAFKGSEITSVSLPSTIERIGDETFADCKNLVRFSLPDGNEKIKVLPSRVFMGCISLKQIDFPAKLEQVSELAFYDCQSIRAIELPLTVRSIGSNAFENCVRLEGISIPEGVKEIELATFKNCHALRYVELPSTLETIGKYAFQYCWTGLVSINIPDNVSKIGTRAFDNCQSLQSISIPKGLKVIEEETFNACLSLKIVVIPEGVEEIKKWAFAACISIEELELPASLKTIGMYALVGMYGLKDINVSIDNLNYCSIDGNLYSKNKELLVQYALGKQDKEFTVPSHVKTIGAAAFAYSPHLEVLNIPKSVNLIRQFVLENCEKISIVNYEGTVAEWNAINVNEYWDLRSHNFTLYCSNGVIK